MGTLFDVAAAGGIFWLPVMIRLCSSVILAVQRDDVGAPRPFYDDAQAELSSALRPAKVNSLARTLPIPRKDILKLRRKHPQKHARDCDEKQAQRREHRDRVPPGRLPHARI